MRVEFEVLKENCLERRCLVWRFRRFLTVKVKTGFKNLLKGMCE